MTLTTFRRERQIPAEIMAIFHELIARDQSCLGPLDQFSQAEVDAFVGLTRDKNPIHQPGPNRFGAEPLVPGLMLTSMIPRLSGVEIPFILNGRNLVNMLTESHFRYPVKIGEPVQMRFHPVGQPETSLLGFFLDIGFAILLSPSGREAVRGKIRLGYM